jgi:hypothetical protein
MMDENVTAETRRKNRRMAERVECGLAVRAIAGEAEAVRNMLNCGIPRGVIDRVFGPSPTRRRAYALGRELERRHG